MQAYVDGVALWSPRLPGWEAAAPVLRGEHALPEASVPRPAPTLLPPNERRRAPDTVAVALEVAARACEHAGVDRTRVASVFTSTHGDLAITHYMCETLASTPELISPTKFHNSVHNAAAGYWSIATGCMAPYTALSAWARSFAAGLIEAFTQLASDGEPVLCVAYDIEAVGPLARVAHSKGVVACALVLVPAQSERSIARIQWSTRGDPAPLDSAPISAAAHELSGNAMSASFALLEALAGRSPTNIRYAAGPELALELQVTPLTRKTQ
ncbi:MAG: beta-ketoacyl synthase chain length factor [Burkholderiales bacterium]